MKQLVKNQLVKKPDSQSSVSYFLVGYLERSAESIPTNVSRLDSELT